MPRRLMEIFMEEGKITKEHVEEAFVRQLKRGGRIGSNLVQLGYLTEDTLTEGLSRLYRKASVPPEAFDKIDSELKRLISAEMAQKYRVIPLKKRGKTLMVVMESPNDLEAIDELKFITGHNIQSLVCPQIRMEFGLEKVYGIDSRYDFTRLIIERTAKPKRREARLSEQKLGFEGIESRLARYTLGKGSLAMFRARSIEDIGEVLITSGGQIAKRTIIFALRSRDSILIGWKATGGGLNDFIVRDYKIPLADVQNLIDLLQEGKYYYGELTGLSDEKGFFRDVCGDEANEVFLMPIFSRGRVFLILYADNGMNPFAPKMVEDLLTLAPISSMALEKIRLRK